MNLPIILLKPSIHRNKEVVFLEFVYNSALVSKIKQLGMRVLWSNQNKMWYIEKINFELSLFCDELKELAIVDTSIYNTTVGVLVEKETIKNKLSKAQRNQLNNFYKYLRGKRFSTSTLKTYTHLVAEFVVYLNEDAISLQAIEKYADDVIVKKRLSVSTHRQFVSAVKHYLTFINAGFDIDFTTVAPKKDRKLPNILSKQEVIELIRVTKNLKHRVCIGLIYSSGLRISELINLKISDIDFQRMVLKVNFGKGRKDRYVPIAQVLLPMLKNYLETYRPQHYFVEGHVLGDTYSAASIRKFLKYNCYKANIYKKVTPHTLRHSYATHLLESGTDIRYIQELLGHSRPETTMLYTKVQSEDLRKITNPLDLIVKQMNVQKKVTN